MLQFMGLQRIGHDRATELTDLGQCSQVMGVLGAVRCDCLHMTLAAVPNSGQHHLYTPLPPSMILQSEIKRILVL